MNDSSDMHSHLTTGPDEHAAGVTLVDQFAQFSITLIRAFGGSFADWRQL
jgi:hypothetical protein